MPISPPTHPLIFLADQNGWSWIQAPMGGGRPDTSTDLDDQGETPFGMQALLRWGIEPGSLEQGRNQTLETSDGLVAYYLADGETETLIVRPPPNANETAELALSAAHELANALSAISGWAQLGLDEPTKMRDALVTVESAAASAQRVARDVLTYGGASSDESCDAASVCRDVAGLLLPIALRHNVQVQTDTPTLAWTRAHRAAVFRVVWNLALNATQMQQNGGLVRIECARRGDTVLISVSDHGPGISPEDQERIFEAHVTRRPGGTGLGLATVKRTLDRVHGTIGVDSTLGEGARFEVSLPRAMEDDERISGVVAGKLPARMLVVEDDDGVRELIETTMALRGIDVVAVVNREAALAIDGEFEVALADLTLPDGRGDSLLEALRTRGTVRRTVITSGQLDPGTLSGPPDAWLPKPFDIHDLLAVLREVRTPASSDGSSGTGSGTGSSSG